MAPVVAKVGHPTTTGAPSVLWQIYPWRRSQLDSPVLGHAAKRQGVGYISSSCSSVGQKSLLRDGCFSESSNGCCVVAPSPERDIRQIQTVFGGSKKLCYHHCCTQFETRDTDCLEGADLSLGYN